MNNEICGTGENIVISECSYKRPGYIFVGWNDSPEGEIIAFPGDEIQIDDEHRTLYAIWEAVWIEMPETGTIRGLIIFITGSFTCIVSLALVGRTIRRNTRQQTSS